MAVDTGCRLLTVNLTTADICDHVIAHTIVAAVRKRWLWLSSICSPTVPMVTPAL